MRMTNARYMPGVRCVDNSPRCDRCCARYVRGLGTRRGRNCEHHERQAHYFSAPEFANHVIAIGLTDRAELAEMSAAWREWGDDPGAFQATFWCEALGWAG